MYETGVVLALSALDIWQRSVDSILSVLTGTVGAVASILTPGSAYSLLVFCLLYTPFVAAIASIRRELGGTWEFFVVVFQCVLAWIISLLFSLLLGVII